MKTDALKILKSQNVIERTNEYHFKQVILKNFDNNAGDWITVYHGTDEKNLESIIKYGLKPFGTRLQNGTEVKYSHEQFGRGINILGINNWEKGIFVTSNLFYALSYGKVIIEAKLKPSGSFFKVSVKDLAGNLYKKFEAGARGHSAFEIYHIDRHLNLDDIFIYRVTNPEDLKIVGVLLKD